MCLDDGFNAAGSRKPLLRRVYHGVRRGKGTQSVGDKNRLGGRTRLTADTMTCQSFGTRALGPVNRLDTEVVTSKGATDYSRSGRSPRRAGGALGHTLTRNPSGLGQSTRDCRSRSSPYVKMRPGHWGAR